MEPIYVILAVVVAVAIYAAGRAHRPVQPPPAAGTPADPQSQPQGASRESLIERQLKVVRERASSWAQVYEQEESLSWAEEDAKYYRDLAKQTRQARLDSRKGP